MATTTEINETLAAKQDALEAGAAEAKPRRKRLRRKPKGSTAAQEAPPTPGKAPKRGAKIGFDNAGARQTKRQRRRVADIAGYQAMLPSGVAWLGADEWSVTLRVSDINYVAADQGRQELIVDQWARFLNSFGSGTRVQITVLNRVLDEADVRALVQKELRGDALDVWREDYNQIVAHTLSTRSANTVTDKYLTLVVREGDQERAESTLATLARESIATLRGMDDCKAEILTRTERLGLISHLLRPHERFTFTEEHFAAAQEANPQTLEYVAPFAIERTTTSGPLLIHSGDSKTWHTTLWVRDFPAWLSDRLISSLTSIKADLTVALHLEPLEQGEGMDLIQRQITQMEMQLADERRKARKYGNRDDDGSLPYNLVSAAEETKALRAELRQSNQKVLSSVLLVGITGESEYDLSQRVGQVRKVIRQMSCTAEVTSFMQEDALTTELPLGLRKVPLRRTLTTGSAAIMIPFTTQEAFDPTGVLYGLNASSGNAIVINRARGINANGFILGSSGSGKGVAAKNEIMNIVTSRPGDDIIIIDPEHEYEPMVQAFGGTIVRVHATSNARLNPLDIDLDDDEDGDPIIRKAADLLDMLTSLINSRGGLTDSQRSLIDRCCVAMYRDYEAAGGPDGGTMPTLVDLREALIATGTHDGEDLAAALEIYTVGSLNAFAQHTNVDIDNRLLSWDISDLGASLRRFGMMVILDQIWKRIARNRREGRRTWVYVDEMHLLFNDKYSATYFRTLYRRVRKWGAGMTGITQNVAEIRENEDARYMLANSEFLLLLRQQSDDADMLCDLLDLSADQRSFFTTVQPGDGLIKAGDAIVPFTNRIPEDSRLFELYNTDFDES